jgi:hypothetical protein
VLSFPSHEVRSIPRAWCGVHSNVLAEPPDAVAISWKWLAQSIISYSHCDSSAKLAHTLPHNHTTHKHLYRPHPLKRNLALPRRLPQPQLRTQLILAHRLRVIDLVAQHQYRRLAQLLHAQECVELGFAFGQALVVLCVDEEDDAADFGEVVTPEASGLGVTAEIEGCEFYVADGEFFRGWGWLVWVVWVGVSGA